MSVPVMTSAKFPWPSIVSLPAPCAKENVWFSVVSEATLLPKSNASGVALSVQNCPVPVVGAVTSGWLLGAGANPPLQWSGSPQPCVGPTVTSSVANVVALTSPSGSRSVAAIVSLKQPSKQAGGVIVRHDRFQPATSCEVSWAVAVKL